MKMSAIDKYELIKRITTVIKETKETEAIPIYFLDGWIIRLEKQGDTKQAATLRRVIDSWRSHN